MPERFQDAYNNVDTKSDIEEDHKMTGRELIIIATLAN